MDSLRSAIDPDMGAIEFTIPGCTAPPTPGDATTTSVSPCLNLPLTLQLANNSVGLSQTYQWQSSPSLTGPWINVGSSSLNSDLTINATGILYYRAQVTCNAVSAFSTPIVITPGLPVAGVYTINSGLPTGSGNFQTFADAISSLKCGISAPITFNVASGSGPYNEQVIIPAIPGTSATNTLTFNGNGSTIAFASADANSRSVVRLDGADRVTIKDFIIDATGGTYGWGFHLSNQADYDSIVGCTITTDGTATSTNFSGIVISGSASSATTAGNNASNAVIMNNVINNGYYGIINYGNSAAPFTDNNRFINNTVNDFYFYGIYNYGSTNSVISGNIIQRPTRTTLTTAYGLYLTTGVSGALVEKNKVQKLFEGNLASTSTAYGIYVAVDGLTTPNVIVNNIVSDISSEGSIYGIYNSGAANMKAYHNTVSLDYAAGAAGAAYGFYQTTSDTAIEFKNNLITVTRGGSGAKYGIYMATSTTPLVSNYNDVFVSATGYYGYNVSPRATLADWQTATSQDANSLFIDPLYTAIGSDYKPTAGNLNDKGTPLGILRDFYDSVRSVANPDLGAIEFTVPGCTAPPTAGDATSTAISPCLNASITLQLINNSIGLSQTYQWQSAPAATGPWTNVGTASLNSDLSTNATGTLYYRALVTCTGVSSFSTPILITPGLPVSGAFTINSAATTGGTNFQTFSDAINFVKCGVSGPVVFNVAAGSGPYNEQVIIPAVSGASAANTITFNGNGAAIAFASTDANARAVVKLDGADFVTLKNFVIDATGGTYGWGIHMTNQADNDSIVGCTVTTDGTATSTNFSGIVISASVTSAASAGNNANNAVIMNNVINNGYYGISNYGNSANPFSGNNKIINNSLNDFYFYGIYNYGNTNPVVSGNTIQRPIRTTLTTAYGIYIAANVSGALVEKNRIQKLFEGNIASTSVAYCIYISADGVGNPNKIVNNIISDISSEGTVYGIYNSGAANMKAYHNTISLDYANGAAGNTYGFYQTTSDTAIEFKNNIVTITRGGTGVKYGIYMSTATTPLVSNYNDVYVNSTGSGVQAFGYNSTARNTLADWTTATSFDANSLSIDPVYTALGTDYTPTSLTLDNKGLPVGVISDINDSLRSASTPDIGAIEFETVLPLKLVDISATRSAKNVIVNWTSAEELNITRYEVERFVNGRDFESAGSVNAVNGGNALRTYRLTDFGILSRSDKVFYRLKIVDKNGSFFYSKIIAVQIANNNNQVAIYPNPVVNELFVRVATDKTERVSIRIADLSGKVILTRNVEMAAGTTVIRLPGLNKLASGTYIVTINAGSKITSNRFVK